MEALGRLAGREALPRLVPHLYDPDPDAAQRRHPGRGRHRAARHRRAARASTPRCRPRCAAQDLVDHLLATLCRRRAPATAAPPPSPWAGSRSRGRSGRSSSCLARARAAGVRHPRPGLHRLPGPRGLRRRPGPCRRRGAPGRRPLPGLDRARRAASTWWRRSSTTPPQEVRAEAAAAIGRLGDEDAAMLLFELLGDESELIQESAMGALARMPAERVVPAAAAGAGQRRRCRCAIRAAETLGLLRDAEHRARPHRRSPRTRARTCGGPRIKALGEIDAPGRARPAAGRAQRREQPGAPAGRALAGQAAGPGARAATCCRCSTTPIPRMRFVALRALGQIRNRRGGAAPARRSWPTSARSCASRRWRRWARCAPRRPCGRCMGVLRGPRPQPAAGGGGEPGRHRRPAGGAAAAAGPGGRALERALRGGHRPGPHPQRQGHRARCWRASHDEDATVRRAAVAALGEIGDARAAGAADPARCRTPACRRRRWRRCAGMGSAALPELERAFAGRGARGAPPAGGPRRAGWRTAGRAGCCWPRWPTTAPRCARRRRWPWATAASWTPCARSWT